MIGSVAAIAAEPQQPDGVALREVTARADLDRIAGLEAAGVPAWRGRGIYRATVA